MRFGSCALCNEKVLQNELDLKICPFCWDGILEGNDELIEKFLKLDFEIIPPINPKRSVVK